MENLTTLENDLMPKRDMRFVTWNVHHSGFPKPLSPRKFEAIKSLEADIVVLTECALGPFVDDTKRDLTALGLTDTRASPFTAGQNQTVISSRFELQDGELRPSGPDAFPFNVIHCRILTPRLKILAVRIPPWSGPMKKASWDWILNAANSLMAHPTAIMGDFNTTPISTKSYGGEHLRELLRRGWATSPQVNTGTCMFRGTLRHIDHIFTDKKLVVSSSENVWERNGIRFGGKGGLSDHACVVVDAEAQVPG